MLSRIIINYYSTVFQSGNSSVCYISGTELIAGSQGTQGLFSSPTPTPRFISSGVRLSTPASPVDNAEETHSIAGFGFQPPLIIWCSPADLSINGNPVGVNTSQGLSEEDLNTSLNMDCVETGV